MRAPQTICSACGHQAILHQPQCPHCDCALLTLRSLGRSVIRPKQKSAGSTLYLDLWQILCDCGEPVQVQSRDGILFYRLSRNLQEIHSPDVCARTNARKLEAAQAADEESERRNCARILAEAKKLEKWRLDEKTP